MRALGQKSIQTSSTLRPRFILRLHVKVMRRTVKVLDNILVSLDDEATETKCSWMLKCDKGQHEVANKNAAFEKAIE